MTATPLKILIIDDEASIRRFLRPVLEGQGYRALEAASGREGLSMALAERPALILLDLGLPDMDGIAVLTALRSVSDTPVIVLSARAQQDDKITALDGGAVDYLTKPFGVGELSARIRVALRLVTAAGAPQEPVIVSGALRVDLAGHQVHLDGVEVRLTPIEFNLLSYLAKNAGKVVTHQQLLREVWGQSAVGKEHYLRIYVHQLRNKIEPVPAKPRFVRTEPGVGYRFMLADS
jgi:two-component system KDP operon response regulator KdpE